MKIKAFGTEGVDFYYILLSNIETKIDLIHSSTRFK